MNKPIRTSQVCMNLLSQIEDRIFVTNLICLPLSSLDIILHMDWFSANRVMLNYFDKTIVFSSTPSSNSVIPIYNTLIISYYT